MRGASRIAAILLVIWAAQAILSFTGDRKTAHFDEQIHLAHGYIYWTQGDYRPGHDTPPLAHMAETFPLLFMNLRLPDGWQTLDKWTLGDRFVNQNAAPAARILLWGRLPVVGFGLLLGWMLWRWTASLAGPAAGLTALALFAFDPLHLSRAWFVGSDLTLSCLALAATWAWWRALGSGRARDALMAGALAGAAIATKFSALFLLPSHALLAFIVSRTSYELPGDAGSLVVRRGGARPRPAVPLVRLTAAAGLAAVAVLLLVYQGGNLTEFAAGFQEQMRAVKGGFHNFFNGHYSATGWWYFFPVAFLVKTPIPILFLSLGGVWAAWRNPDLRRHLPALLIPPAVLFLLACRSSVQLGLRYILPLYPFLMILGGLAATAMMRRTAGRIVLGGLLL
ncbi:MAG: glycosyltransferase family 39 protein, partial [bacterium]